MGKAMELQDEVEIFDDELELYIDVTNMLSPLVELGLTGGLYILLENLLLRI